MITYTNIIIYIYKKKCRKKDHIPTSALLSYSWFLTHETNIGSRVKHYLCINHKILLRGVALYIRSFYFKTHKHTHEHLVSIVLLPGRNTPGHVQTCVKKEEKNPAGITMHIFPWVLNMTQEELVVFPQCLIYSFCVINSLLPSSFELFLCHLESFSPYLI